MTTSGSVDFSITRDEIITEALELLGVLEAGETPTPDDVTSASRTLNMLIKAWQTDGLAVFSIKRAYLFTEQNKSEYTLSANGDHYTYDFTKQSIDGDVASGSNTVELSDASDFNDGDNIGIYQDDGTMLWTTGTKVVNTVTISDVTTDTVSDGATVYFYTDKADCPEKIVEAALRNDSLNERPLIVFSRKEWSELSNKTYDGKVTEVYYDERVANPSLFVWPQSSDPRDLLILWVKRLREDFDSASDTPDFPQRWYFPLAFNLAVTIGPKFGTPSNNPNFKEVKAQAKEWYEKAQNYDSQPESSVYMAPDEY